MDHNHESAGATPPAGEPVLTQKPVAYGTNGQPLYAAPTGQVPPQAQERQVVHMTRSVEPVDVEISPELKQRHDDSMRAFPWLNLSDHEYIVRAIRRHSIGMWGPLIATSLSISLVFIFMMDNPLKKTP